MPQYSTPGLARRLTEQAIDTRPEYDPDAPPEIRRQHRMREYYQSRQSSEVPHSSAYTVYGHSDPYNEEGEGGEGGSPGGPAGSADGTLANNGVIPNGPLRRRRVLHPPEEDELPSSEEWYTVEDSQPGHSSRDWGERVNARRLKENYNYVSHQEPSSQPGHIRTQGRSRVPPRHGKPVENNHHHWIPETVNHFVHEVRLQNPTLFSRHECHELYKTIHYALSQFIGEKVQQLAEQVEQVDNSFTPHKSSTSPAGSQSRVSRLFRPLRYNNTTETT